MLTTTYSQILWQKVSMDVVYMPRHRGFLFLVLAREWVIGWVEGRALRKADSKEIAKFVYEDILCRWSQTKELIVDGGPENQKWLDYLAQRWGMRKVTTSAQNPQANGFVEAGHIPIVKGLAKLKGSWVDNLHTVLLADRISVHEPTGYPPMQLMTGQNPILPIEMEIPTWQVLPWGRIKSREELLAMRAAQLDIRDENIIEARERTQRLRLRRKEYWDEHNEILHEDMRVGDLVLLWDSLREVDMSRDKKLDQKWLGPYRIAESYQDRGHFRLEELDGVKFKTTTPGHKLKKFIPRQPEDIREEDREQLQLWDEERFAVEVEPRTRSSMQPTVEDGEDQEGRYDDWGSQEDGEDIQTRQLRQLESRRPQNREPTEDIPEERARHPAVVIPYANISRGEYRLYEDSDEEEEDA